LSPFYKQESITGFVIGINIFSKNFHYFLFLCEGVMEYSYSHLVAKTEKKTEKKKGEVFTDKRKYKHK